MQFMNKFYYHGYKLWEQASETLDWDSAEYLFKKREKFNIEVCVTREVKESHVTFLGLGMLSNDAMFQCPEHVDKNARTLLSGWTVGPWPPLGRGAYSARNEPRHTSEDFLGSVHRFVNALLKAANWNASLSDTCICQGLSRLRKVRNNFCPQHCSCDKWLYKN